MLNKPMSVKETTHIHYQVRKAIECGELIKQPCVLCGSIKTHGHHSDYDKPLKVIWLCHTHHRNIHKGESYQNNKFGEAMSKKPITLTVRITERENEVMREKMHEYDISAGEFIRLLIKRYGKKVRV